MLPPPMAWISFGPPAPLKMIGDTSTPAALNQPFSSVTAISPDTGLRNRPIVSGAPLGVVASAARLAGIRAAIAPAIAAPAARSTRRRVFTCGPFTVAPFASCES
jgi:hypothetical protein